MRVAPHVVGCRGLILHRPIDAARHLEPETARLALTQPLATASASTTWARPTMLGPGRPDDLWFPNSTAELSKVPDRSYDGPPGVQLFAVGQRDHVQLVGGPAGRIVESRPPPG